MNSEMYTSDPVEKYVQPAIPRKTGRRLLPLVLLSVTILVSAIVSIAGLVGGSLGLKRLSGETILPTVVGVAEATPIDSDKTVGTVQMTLITQTEPTGTNTESLSLSDIYKCNIASVVCVQATTVSGNSVGTGVIFSSDGYIITNYHVIESASACTVLLSDNSSYEARLIGSDAQTDLAVLKIDATGLQAAVFGDSDSLQVGDTVVAIGNPLGIELRGTMTDGIVSAINRNINIDGREMTLIQTNAAMNSGNSGGPLINISGQVVGINTVKFSAYASDSVEGIGFAIPITSAKPIIEELINNGFVSGRPSIGISGESVPQYAQVYYRLPDGVYITGIDETSDAYFQGIRAGDIIVALDNTRVTSIDELNAAKNIHAVGDTVTLTIYHGGLYYSIDIILGETGAG